MIFTHVWGIALLFLAYSITSAYFAKPEFPTDAAENFNLFTLTLSLVVLATCAGMYAGKLYL